MAPFTSYLNRVEIDVNQCTYWEWAGFVDRTIHVIAWEEAQGKTAPVCDTNALRPLGWRRPMPSSTRLTDYGDIEYIE